MPRSLFDAVPECLVETLLIVHGSGDRNHPRFTNICETWTRILAPWIRTPTPKKDMLLFYGKEYARWNGKSYKWQPNGRLYEKCTLVNGVLHGETQYWCGNGRLQGRGMHCHGREHGEWKWWYDNGVLEGNGTYQNGLEHGLCEWWHDNGQIKSRVLCRDGIPDGECQEWWYGGNIRSKRMYDNGKTEGEQRWSQTGRLYVEGVYDVW